MRSLAWVTAAKISAVNGEERRGILYSGRVATTGRRTEAQANFPASRGRSTALAAARQLARLQLRVPGRRLSRDVLAFSSEDV